MNWLPDALLASWERAIVAGQLAPTEVDGEWWWDLDQLSAARLRALCWPRRRTA